MSFELFIALRYLLARRKQAFISLISLISTLGVTVGVMALVIALALMTGLQGELRDRILGSMAHVYVWKTGGIEDYQAEIQKLRGIEGIVGAGPAILGKALIVSDRAEAFISLKGVDPALERSVTDIGKSMQKGSVAALTSQAEGDPPGILLGKDLAQQLGADVGDSISLLTPQGTLTPMGMLPRQRRARVVGIYSLGLFEFDSQYGFVSLDFAERLMGKAAPDLIELRVADIFMAPAVAARVPDLLGPDYVAQDWQDMNQNLFSALWIEKMAISITIGLIVIVAALQIVASLILLVMEKNRDIAILKTMGASATSIMIVFMLQGVIIGTAGTAVGASAGYALAYVLDRYKLISVPMDVYQISYVPFTVEMPAFILVIFTTILICFLATIYPARQAARLDPAQALRYE